MSEYAPLTRRVGQTAQRLPALGFGCAPLGNLHTIISEKDADETLDAAWQSGVRYFDTSPWYGLGLSELRLGRYLRSKPRDTFVVSTKVGRTFHRPRNVDGFRPEFWEGGLPFDYRFDYTYDGVMRSFEQSLMRLGLNAVDLILVHDLDRAEMGSDAQVAQHMRDLQTSGWRALEALRSSGEIAAIGAGVNILGTIPAMLARFELDFFLVAMPYTLLNQAALDTEFPLCMERGVSIVIGAPYASGILATGAGVAEPRYNYEPAPPEIIARTRQIEIVCAAHEVPLKAAAIQFALSHPSVASVIPGALSPEHARDNCAMAGHQIPAAFWADLRDRGLIDPRTPPFQGEAL
jgi:D-threo-aldose 1-dehydrogenase